MSPQTVPATSRSQYVNRSHREPRDAAFLLTIRSASGFVSIEGACRSCVEARTRQAVADGGDVVAFDEIPQAPEPAPIEPVGLDAIDPTAPAVATPAEPFRPNWVLHPGEILGELLAEKNVSPGLAEKNVSPGLAAKALGWPVDLVGAVVGGKSDVTLEMAGALGTVFGPSVGFWLRLQERHAQHSARRAAGKAG